MSDPAIVRAAKKFTRELDSRVIRAEREYVELGTPTAMLVLLEAKDIRSLWKQIIIETATEEADEVLKWMP